VDAGATLIKLAIRGLGGDMELDTLPAAAFDEAARRLSAARPQRVGLTGGGALRIARLLASDTACVNEFEAWREGARQMLEREGLGAARFLLVSVGTGTSAMLVDAGAVRRVGGTALGGGTLVGLGAALLGTGEFARIAALAARGDRRRVDLLVSDIYPEGELPLPGRINAASFAKLARDPGRRAQASDLAHALMGLVGENVALICAGLAAAAGVERIVFGGSALRANPALTAILGGACRALGRDPVFLPEGEFAGALGALALGEADTGAEPGAAPARKARGQGRPRPDGRKRRRVSRR
jgi:type II pantothenate kinase